MKQTAMAWAAKSGDHRPDWRTPWPLFDEIVRRYAFGGRVDVDVCADAANAKAPRFITAEMDALITPWGEVGSGDVAWLQPPFDGIGPLIARAVQMLDEDRIAQCLAFVPARCDRAWWHTVVLRRGRQIALEGRATFEPPPGYVGKVSSWAEPMALISFERPLSLSAYAWHAPRAVDVADLFEGAHEGEQALAVEDVNA